MIDRPEKQIKPSRNERITMSMTSYVTASGGACGVMVTVIGNEHGDMSSNPGRDW